MSQHIKGVMSYWMHQSNSSESDMSRFTLGESEEGDKPEIRQNNSFLHDNVD